MAKSLLKNRSDVQKSTPVVSKSTVVVFRTYGVKSEVILTNICYKHSECSLVIVYLSIYVVGIQSKMIIYYANTGQYMCISSVNVVKLLI